MHFHRRVGFLVLAAAMDTHDPRVFLGRLRVTGRRVIDDLGIRPDTPHGCHGAETKPDREGHGIAVGGLRRFLSAALATAAFLDGAGFFERR
jgi:hypothetical protein